MQESRPLSTDCGRLSSAYLLFLPRPPRWLSTAYWVALKRRNIHRLLSMGLSVEDVSKGTSLPLETVEEIKKQMIEKNK